MQIRIPPGTRQSKVKKRWQWDVKEKEIVELKGDSKNEKKPAKLYFHFFFYNCDFRSFNVFNELMIDNGTIERPKQIPQPIKLGCPLSKADKGLTKVLCFIQSLTILRRIGDPFLASWLANQQQWRLWITNIPNISRKWYWDGAEACLRFPNFQVFKCWSAELWSGWPSLRLHSNSLASAPGL